MITISIKEVAPGRGVFETRLGHRLLCLSRTPLLSAARILIEDGHLPSDRISMQHVDSATVSIVTTVGKAAKLCVEEGEGRPRFRPWKGRESWEGSSGIASKENSDLRDMEMEGRPQ